MLIMSTDKGVENIDDCGEADCKKTDRPVLAPEECFRSLLDSVRDFLHSLGSGVPLHDVAD